ncbi:MAG: hypothetical protein LBC71_01555 [Oscillospiraceae bacterium]|jgi:hypothetical protein|nr:hypothetical protein [Oscillospiraceae bacterium]
MIYLEEFFKTIASITNSYVVISLLIGAAVTFFATKMLDKSKARKEYEKEKFDNLLKAFIITRNRIHMGAAFDFSDLDRKDQEELQHLLIQNKSYADRYLHMCIYFFTVSEDQDEVNQVYNTVTEIIYREYERIRRKIYWNLITRVRYYFWHKKIRKELSKKNQPKYASSKIYYVDY